MHALDTNKTNVFLAMEAENTRKDMVVLRKEVDTEEKKRRLCLRLLVVLEPRIGIVMRLPTAAH